MSISKNDINKAIKYVIDIYSEKYNCSKEETKYIVNNSAFIALLKDNPDYVLHYSLEYWVKDIKEGNLYAPVSKRDVDFRNRLLRKFLGRTREDEED